MNSFFMISVRCLFVFGPARGRVLLVQCIMGTESQQKHHMKEHLMYWSAKTSSLGLDSFVSQHATAEAMQ